MTNTNSPAAFELQVQPTKTSCGPTCIAMLVGLPSRDVIARLPNVRIKNRVGRRTHGTNVGEIIRLLREFGFTLGRRIRREAVPIQGVYLLRVERGSGNWHWALVHNATVYDPDKTTPRHTSDYLRFSWYAIETARREDN